MKPCELKAQVPWSQTLEAANVDPGRRGRTYCSIHHGKNPTSISYNDETGYGHCFTCNWRGDIPLGKLTIIAGDPDRGKSLLSLDISARDIIPIKRGVVSLRLYQVGSDRCGHGWLLKAVTQLNGEQLEEFKAALMPTQEKEAA